MKSSSAARRLAKALIEVGVEDKSFARYGEELRTLKDVFRGNPELAKVLLNPMHKLEERKGLMVNVAKSLGLSDSVSRFAGILVETRKAGLMADIADAYAKLEDGLAGRLRATVESPVDLSPELIEEIKRKLSKDTGKDVSLSFHKNPALLGGLVVRLENVILDGSLKTQLGLMKEKILEGVI